MAFSLSPNPLSLLPQAIKLIEQGHAIAMATLINVEGGSPYPEGSQMLVSANGEHVGQLTGGCAEKAIIDHALQSLSAKLNSVHRYGSGSPYFDIQLPCGSGVDVLIDVQTKLSEYEQLVSMINQRQGVTQQVLSANNSTYTKWHTPQPRLIIMGQGPILLQSCLIALIAGFDVLPIINDEDSRRLLLPNGLTPIQLDQLSNLDGLHDPFTGLVSVFHEHDNELNMLTEAVKTDMFYIGALGSRKTHEERLKKLRQFNVVESQLNRIHGPVGVNIRSTTPAQIGISIVAEAIDYLNSNTNSLVETNSGLEQ